MSQAEFFYRTPNAPKPNKPNHIGTSVMMLYGGKLLLEHRQDSDVWAIIGGGLKVDESLSDCAMREVQEETGLMLNEQQLCFYKIYDDPSRIASYPDGNVLRVITVVYRTELIEEPELKCSDESRELKFFTREELTSLPIAATHIPIIEDYIREKENRDGDENDA